MLALYEMIENERNEIYSTGIKRRKSKGKNRRKNRGKNRRYKSNSKENA